MRSFIVSTEQLRQFRRWLLAWYRQHGRNLPWRQTHDPYRILISEVMLQQTQVVTVIERYHQWLKRFPTVQALADAKVSEVLKVWSGLGYNRRALALHKLANRIVTEYQGKFPQTIAELKALPGIGDYTAHAILSFAFEARVPLVDTNIKRVLGRIFFGYRKLETLRDDQGIFWTLSKTVIDLAKSPYDVNQALMDFGALVCLAKKPKCAICPLQTICQSYPEILTAQPERLRVKTKRHEPLYYGQPRRIWRGRILKFLHTQPHNTASLTAIGQHLQADWQASRNAWLRSVVQTLVKDGLANYKANRITLP